MRIEYLRTFIKLCEYKSFSKLAEDLNISQSTLSHRISQLEEEFANVILIERTTKKFELTHAGEILLDHAKKILALYDTCEQEILKYSKQHVATITISASTLPGSHILPKFITNFKSKYPNVDFKIIINNSRQSIDFLKKDVVDFAGVGGLMDEKEDLFDIKIIYEDELVFICSPKHEIVTIKNKQISLNDLFSYPFITREEGSGTRKVFELNFEKYENLKQKLVINDNNSIITAVSNSDYISIMSEIIAKKSEDAGLITIFRIKEYPVIAKRKIYFLKRKGKVIEDLKNRFWEHINMV